MLGRLRGSALRAGLLISGGDGRALSGTRGDPVVDLAFEMADGTAFAARIQRKSLGEEALSLKIAQLPIADADLSGGFDWSENAHFVGSVRVRSQTLDALRVMSPMNCGLIEIAFTWTGVLILVEAKTHFGELDASKD